MSIVTWLLVNLTKWHDLWSSVTFFIVNLTMRHDSLSRDMPHDLIYFRQQCNTITNSQLTWLLYVYLHVHCVTWLMSWSISGSNSILSGTDIWLNCCTWWMSLPHSFPCELTHNLIYFRVTQLTPRDMPHHLIYFRQQLNAIGHWHMTWLLCVMYLMKIIYFWEQFYTANYEGYDMTDDLQRTATHCNSLQLIHTILHRQLQREWHDWQPPLF